MARAAGFGTELAFDLQLMAPELPAYDVSPGHTEMSWLRKLTMDGALERVRSANRASGGPPAARPRTEHDRGPGFPCYFLAVYDIVAFCRRNDIYLQGQGSAVCYALRITNVDAVRHHPLFERFPAPARDGPPDIDVDIESDHREEAIQHVYARCAREHTARPPTSSPTGPARRCGTSPGRSVSPPVGAGRVEQADRARGAAAADRRRDCRGRGVAVSVAGDTPSTARQPRHALLGSRRRGASLCPLTGVARRANIKERLC